MTERDIVNLFGSVILQEANKSHSKFVSDFTKAIDLILSLNELEFNWSHSSESIQEFCERSLSGKAKTVALKLIQAKQKTEDEFDQIIDVISSRQRTPISQRTRDVAFKDVKYGQTFFSDGVKHIRLYDDLDEWNSVELNEGRMALIQDSFVVQVFESCEPLKMEDFIKTHSARLDEIAEQHDGLGTIQGVLENPQTNFVDVVFEHAIVSIDSSLRVVLVRYITRFDEQ